MKVPGVDWAAMRASALEWVSKQRQTSTVRSYCVDTLERNARDWGTWKRRMSLEKALFVVSEWDGTIDGWDSISDDLAMAWTSAEREGAVIRRFLENTGTIDRVEKS